ncbi:hypothetical protein V1264_023423 [Littorina saxatilis]|uniref:Major facilitator superfamily (MFS) profile domain-containing protein n=1 Tax=Littorina saxatilis TaxID=31220 RepID=A0AAN9GA13_9CAEN
MGDKDPFVFPDKMESQSKIYLSRKEKRQWTGILMCGTAILYAARTIMPVCIVEVADDMDWNKTQSGVVLSAFFWGYMMTQVLGGYVSDRVGGERVLLMASVVWSSITLCTPLLIQLSVYNSYSLYIVVLFRVLLGVSQGVHFPSVTSAVARKVPNEERSLSFSLIATGANCGNAFK